MRRFATALVVTALLTLLASKTARAQMSQRTTEERWVGDLSSLRDDGARARMAERRRARAIVSLTLNPLSLALKRFGFNAEILFGDRHALMLNPFVQTIASTGYAAFPIGSSVALGGEIAYHLYTAGRGLSGLFVGPFVTCYQGAAYTIYDDLTPALARGFLAYGGGVDVGGLGVWESGFTMGGGGGILFAETRQTSGGPFRSATLARLLWTVGWSF
jgi:hypothetical protein